MWNRTRQTSGRWASELRRGACLAVVVSLLGCNYTFQAGSGLPPHVQTLAIIPFDNETDRFEVSQELHQLLIDELPRSFGVRTGGEEFAEAVIQGTIRNYQVQAESYRPEGGTSTVTQVIERQVRLSVSVQVIDRVNSLILWENTGLTAQGEYLDAAGNEDEGRDLALSRVVQGIIDGLQSNW